MEEKKYDSGDLVQLKSGGCVMVVHSLDSAGNVLCCWHNPKGESSSVYYRAAQLKDADPQSPPAAS
jgi:uncharacterized protein YodC (DUF2158 family)